MLVEDFVGVAVVLDGELDNVEGNDEEHEDLVEDAVGHAKE